jgi:hypothetical protein
VAVTMAVAVAVAIALPQPTNLKLLKKILIKLANKNTPLLLFFKLKIFSNVREKKKKKKKKNWLLTLFT